MSPSRRIITPLPLLALLMCGGTLPAGPGNYAPDKWEQRTPPNVVRIIKVLNDTNIPLKQRIAVADDQVPEVRRQLLNYLHRLNGVELQKSVAFFFLRNDKDRNMRVAAVSSLGNVKPMDQETIDVLTDVINDEAPMVQSFACQTVCFAQISPHVDMTKAFAALMNAVDTKDAGQGFSVARNAVRALGWQGHKPSRQRIVRFFNENKDNPSAACICAESLARLGGADDTLLHTISVSLSSSNWNIRHMGAKELGKCQSTKIVSFLIHHLAGELARTVNDLKLHSIDPRVWRGLIEQLRRHSGADFGSNVNNWIDWHEQNGARFESWTDRDAPRIKAQLLDDYQWHNKVRGWHRSVQRVLEKGRVAIELKPLDPSVPIDGPRLHRSLRYVRQHAPEAPPSQMSVREPMIRAMNELMARRQNWDVQDPSDAGVLGGPVTMQMLEKEIRATLLVLMKD